MMVVGVPLMFFFTSSFPAALQFYFMTASIPALFQTWLVYQSWFRRAIGLPPIPKPEVVAPAKPGVGGAISSMKQSFSQVTEMAAQKQKESSKKKSNRQQLDDEIKLTEQYYESLRERMAEMEKSQRMKRRP
jgi:membrane protein insertase Oxa1/YidC/SpoIIIJ